MSALYLDIAFSFIPAGAVYFMVWRNKTPAIGFRHLICGVLGQQLFGRLLHWFACLDFGVVSVYVFDAEAFQGDAAGPFFLTFRLRIYYRFCLRRLRNRHFVIYYIWNDFGLGFVHIRPSALHTGHQRRFEGFVSHIPCVYNVRVFVEYLTQTRVFPLR